MKNNVMKGSAFKKYLSMILLCIMMTMFIPQIPASAMTAGDKIAEIKQTYPVGSAFNENFNGIQCKGFSNYVFFRMFGLYLEPYPESNGELWKLSNNNSSYCVGELTGSSITAQNVKTLLRQAYCGDIIQTKRNTSYKGYYGYVSPHSMVVEFTTDWGIHIYEANYPSNNRVNERDVSWSEFAKTYDIGITLNRAKNYTSLYSTTQTPHQHNFCVNKYSLPEHPHYMIQACYCGAQRTSSVTTMSRDCQTCYPPPPTPPSAPSIKVSEANFAVGKSLTVSWNAVDKATSYDVSLTHTSDASKSMTSSVGGTSTTFNINYSGSYKVTVKAKNEHGSSGNSNTVTIRAYDPSTVIFVDYDGTVLNSQKVRYGESAAEPAETPSREGYTFTGWDKSFSKITTDTTVTAQYKINTYTVKFINREGETISTQKIEYGSSAKAPTPPDAPTGYKFSGWDTEDYLWVKKDLNVHTVYLWEKEDLPIKFTAEPIVKRNEMGSGYTADLTLYNYPDITTDGKIVITLKTSEGKMVASKTEAISLSAGESATRSIFVPYDGVASTADVTVVAIIDNDKTGVPISESLSIDVDLNLEWSDWSIVKPADNENLIVEERTEYRKRNKETTSSANSSMSGWTKYNTTSSWGNWSGWLDYNPGSSSTRQTKTQTVNPTYKTQYNYSGYKGWKGYNYRFHFCPVLLGNMGYSTPWIESGWIDTNIGLTNKEAQYCNCHGTFYGYYDYNGNHYYYKSTRQVVDRAGYTQWQYRDLKYTYHYYRWKEWGEWSPDEVIANSNREVETRKTYRYKSEFSKDMEDNEGTRRNINGKIENIDDGKQVTLYVFKGTNTDPTESQLEYVGQSTLTNGGCYSFDYITKEEPSEKTGNFIIMVGVEGADAPFYVDTIKAPTPVYTVEFAVDGMVVDEQEISEGNSATVPISPQKEGYTFVGWDSGVTNIRDNMTINAVFVPNKYSVIFLDWDNRTIEAKTFNYGDVIEPPEATEKEGSTFAGWDKILDGTTTVTENIIITATYTLNEYEVVFYDSDGSIITKQRVKYGESAEIPGNPELDGFVFDKWDCEVNLLSVTQNLNAYPEFKYEQTADEPLFYSYEAEETNDYIVMLSANNADDVIYYTTDGTDPYIESSELGIENVNGSVYSEALVLKEGTVVKAITYSENKNTSNLAVFYVTAFETENTSNYIFEISTAEISKNNVILTIRNISQEDASANIYIAAYNSNDCLLSINQFNVTDLESGSSQTVQTGCTNGAAYYKAFLWEDSVNIKPITEAIRIDV